MTSILRKLVANRSLLKNLVVRDLKQRYVGSIGGWLWSVIRPIVLLISYTFLFTVIMGQRLGPQFGTDSFPIFLYMPMLLMFAQGLGWIVAGLHVFVRDTIQGLDILLFLWLWFTPVFYSADLVPARLRYVFNLNPMAIIVTGYRNSLLHLPQ